MILFFLLLLSTVNSYRCLHLRPLSSNTFAIRHGGRGHLVAFANDVDKTSESIPHDGKGHQQTLDKTEGQRKMKVGSGSAINQLIISTIEDKDKSPKERLKNLKLLVRQKKNFLNHVHAATMLQRCARNKLVITEAISLQDLSQIFAKASQMRIVRSVEAAHAIYGLRVLSPETRDIKQYLNQLTHMVLDCDEPFKAQEIGNALYGLQKFSCDSIEVRKLLNVLGFKFKNPAAQLSPQELSNAIYGLRKMNSECEEVVRLLEVLTQKTIECKEAFNCLCVGNSLNGLQGMSSKNKAVIDLVRALVFKVAKSPEELNSITIGSALMGVRRMTAETTEVRTLLAILALKINDSKVLLDPVSFSMAFNGLRSMDETTIEMKALLGTLADKTNSMREEVLTPNILSNALSGLKMLTGESAETRQVVAAILNKMGAPSDGEAPSGTRSFKHPCIGQFDSLDIGRALYGLQNMSPDSCPELRPLLERLASSIRTSKGPLLAWDAGLALYGLKSHKEESPATDQIISAITLRLSLSGDVMSAKTLSMAMMGLQGMSSESSAVRDLLAVLTNRMGVFDSQACGNVLYAMKKMTSDKAEVRAFLSALAPKIEACEQHMTAQELANAFYGLQGMDSVYPETRNMVRVLTQKLIETKDKSFTGQGIGNALSGFQSMSLVDGPQVAVALGYLADQVESCAEVMSPLDLSNALYGLQGISSDSLDVRALLNALIMKMKQSDEVYTGRDIGYSLIGLSGMQPVTHDEVHEIFEELCVKVSRSEFKGQPSLLFMQFGKGVRVRRGRNELTLDNAKEVVNKKSRRERAARVD